MISVRNVFALAFVLLSISASIGAPSNHDAAVPEELRLRDGLPNVFRKLKTGQEVRVAYLGGSITKAEGWRVKSFAWLKQHYPQSDFRQIDAAVPGTGADFAACRVDKDVLSQKPDLVFVEFRVNGGGGFEARAIEGVIRKIWTENPQIDICLVYTIGRWMIKELSAGKQTGFGTIMERMANAYGIPSIDLGVEVIKRLEAGALEFQSPKATAGKLWFSKDGVHPGDEGHEMYGQIIARSLVEMEKQGVPGPHALPPELTPNNFQFAELLPISAAKASAGWESVNVESDPVYQEDSFRTGAMLQEAIQCRTAEESLSVEWDGRLIGFSTIPQGEAMEVEFTIDDQAPQTFKLAQEPGKKKLARFFYAKEQPPGKHRAVLKVTKIPPGTTYFAGQFLIPCPSRTSR